MITHIGDFPETGVTISADEIPVGTVFTGRIVAKKSVVGDAESRLLTRIYGGNLVEIIHPSNTWNNAQYLNILNYNPVNLIVATSPIEEK